MDDNSDVEVREEVESVADSEATTDCPPPISITIPPPMEDEASGYLGSSPSCSEVTYDDDDRASSNGNSAPSLSIPPSIGTSPAATTRSLGSRSSTDGFHSSTPSSLRIDQELVAQACASLGQAAADVQELDLSTNTRKPRRPLKSLRALSELSSLVQLDVSGNAIERLDGLQVFTEMQTLTLARNNLRSLGAPLFALQRLTHLDLSGNFITHLPRAFSGLTQLEALNLSGNNLSTLKEVDVLAPLANLLSCNLSANPFCRLPTYKDYVLCNLRSLERLDDMQISTTARDRAAKRFGAAMFSQDACLREADRVHESEQNRLLQAQSALEAENLRLKGELQVKSKLLQNKSRAWSSATNQLLQLQQEVAMLNLDRRRSVSLPSDEPSTPEQIAMAIAARAQARQSEPVQQRPRSAPRIPSPERSVEKRRGSFSDHDTQRSWNAEVDTDAKSPCQVAHQATSPFQPSAPKTPREVLIERKGKMFVDASCSPLRVIPTAVADLPDEAPTDSGLDHGTSYEDDPTPSRQEDAGETTSAYQTAAPSREAYALSPPKQRERADHIDQVRRALSDFDSTHGMMSPTATSFEFGGMGRSGRSPTFEDDAACPAYEDTALQGRSSSASNLSTRRPHSLAGSPASGSHSLPPSPTSSPSRLRRWFRKQNDLRLMTPPPSPPRRRSSPFKPTRRPSLEASPLAPFVDKDVLARQIQALQSCKQSLLTEIRNEEHILHVLKQESAQYEDQIDRLSVNIQACIDGDPSAIQFSFASPGSPRSSSKKRRDEETSRARLEILRNKLRFAEDKEKEIETSMVRMTKRVLQADLSSSERAAGHRERFTPLDSPADTADVPFDKEIFALTHKLQLVIVEKEEIHMQMSQLMAQLRGQSGVDDSAFDLGTDGESEPKVTSKQAQSLAKSRQMVEELRTRHREVADRIHIKEKRITALLEELREVEAELEHISRLNESSALSPLFQRERSASMEFLQSMRSLGKQESATAHTTTESSPDDAAAEGQVEATTASSEPTRDQTEQQINATDSHQASEGLLPINLPFKELLSPEELEKIKADIYEKLSQQLATSAVRSGEQSSTDGYRRDLHEAIAAALETRLQLALNPLAHTKADNPISPADNSEQVVAQDQTECVAVPTAPDTTSDEVYWDRYDEFAPVESYYARKYVMAKDRVADFVGSVEDSEATNPKLATRFTGAQRILKMCERLSAAEAQYKVDPVTKIELDQLGKNRSSLKMILHCARDLPTTHLRTKNLDPYVSLEVVYPSHSVPLQGNNDSAAGKMLRSQTKKKSIYPVWDEDFEFSPILSLNGYLHVRVLNDRRLSREQLVGETRIPIRTLLHQRRIVEWFSLGLTVPPAATGAVPPERVVSKLCGGAVKLQLHLTFSSVERYKRVIDELVSRYFHDHGQLPSFIDAVEDCEKKSEQTLPGEQPEQNAEPVSIQQDDVNVSTYERRQQEDVASHFPLDELDTSLPPYRTWKANKPDSPPQQVALAESSTASRTSMNPANTHASSTETTRLSAERSRALWEPRATVVTDRQLDLGRKQLPVVDERRVPAATAIDRRKQAPLTSSASFHHQAHKCHSKARAASNLHQHASLRRARNETPECFDEYSPYHPAFKSTDLLDSANEELSRSDARAGGAPRAPDLNRKTDLRIFKSPSVSRRPPSTGFPERYIGLDNQTSERLKRIFGRMDGTPSS